MKIYVFAIQSTGNISYTSPLICIVFVIQHKHLQEAIPAWSTVWQAVFIWQWVQPHRYHRNCSGKQSISYSKIYFPSKCIYQL